MSERIEQLKKSWEKRSCDAREKVRNTIRVMIASEMEITFSGVAKQSGVARSFLYKDPEIKQEIEKYRNETRDMAIRKAELRNQGIQLLNQKIKRSKSWRKKSGN